MLAWSPRTREKPPTNRPSISTTKGNAGKGSIRKARRTSEEVRAGIEGSAGTVGPSLGARRRDGRSVGRLVQPLVDPGGGRDPAPPLEMVHPHDLIVGPMEVITEE